MKNLILIIISTLILVSCEKEEILILEPAQERVFNDCEEYQHHYECVMATIDTIGSFTSFNVLEYNISGVFEGVRRGMEFDFEFSNDELIITHRRDGQFIGKETFYFEVSKCENFGFALGGIENGVILARQIGIGDGVKVDGLQLSWLDIFGYDNLTIALIAE